MIKIVNKEDSLIFNDKTEDDIKVFNSVRKVGTFKSPTKVHKTAQMAVLRARTAAKKAF